MTDKEKTEKADYTDFASRAETGVWNGKRPSENKVFQTACKFIFYSSCNKTDGRCVFLSSFTSSKSRIIKPKQRDRKSVV